jgi:Holliday junction resolvase RusA-like endonuclease
MIEFFLVCVPPTANHQNKKIIRLKMRDGREFLKLGDKPEKTNAQQMIDGLLTPYRPRMPLQGPTTLTLEFTWPWNKGETKRNRARRLIPRTVRPDASNLAITTENRLVALRFLEDDNQVVELVVRKFFGDHPGIGVLIEPCLDPVQRILPPMAMTPEREGVLFG